MRNAVAPHLIGLEDPRVLVRRARIQGGTTCVHKIARRDTLFWFETFFLVPTSSLSLAHVPQALAAVSFYDSRVCARIGCVLVYNIQDGVDLMYDHSAGRVFCFICTCTGQRGGRPMSGRMRTGQVTAGPSREAAYGVALSQEVKVTDRPVTQQVSSGATWQHDKAHVWGGNAVPSTHFNKF